jgi:hypothetical protein
VLVEHISAWSDVGLDADGLLGAFSLSATDRTRLADCRRLAALHWLLLLRPGTSTSRRNPAGTQLHQAERLLALL